VGGQENIPKQYKVVTEKYRVNERIRARQVRVISNDGKQLGAMATTEALSLARQQDLDLVEVASNSEPPVCRILDYGKLKYLQGKKERESQKGRKTSLLREVRVRPRIGQHDMDAKVRKVRELLGTGAKVKVSVMFRGREITHPELGVQLLKQIAEDVQEEGKLERPPSRSDRFLSIILVPDGKKKEKDQVKEKVQQSDAQNEDS
jgi:translation initiation factor IF-3